MENSLNSTEATEHRAKVYAEALAALRAEILYHTKQGRSAIELGAGVDDLEQITRAMLGAIAECRIPHLRIKY